MAASVSRPFNSRGLRAIALPFSHYRLLDPMRRIALIGAIAIAVSSLTGFPNFGWLELSQLLIAVSVLRMLARPIEDLTFPLPFHDGTLIAAGAAWCVIVTMINAFDGADPLTELIALAGCALIAYTGSQLRSYERPYWFE